MKVLFICKLDVITKNIMERMKVECEVLQCDFIPGEARKIIRTEKPDIIFISYDELVDDVTFCDLLDGADDIPILVLCNKDDLVAKKYRESNLDYIFRPVKMDEIFDALRKKLNLETTTSNAAKPEETPAEEVIEDDRPRILALDDNPQILRGIKAILKDEYNVSLATTVQAALTQLDNKKNKFDLILLDYEMPEVDGLTALQLIKSDPELLHIPVVFLSGVSDKEKIMKLVQYNPDAYLLKPIDAGQLKAAVRNFIKK